jgi:putative transposase
MSENKQKQTVSPEHEMGLTSDDLARRGARQVIQQAIETELAELLANCGHVRTQQGKKAVVCNGYLPQRALLAGAG